MSDRIVLYVQYLTLGLKEYGMGEIDGKGRITFSKDVRQSFGLVSGIKVKIDVESDLIIIEKVLGYAVIYCQIECINILTYILKIEVPFSFSHLLP